MVFDIFEYVIFVQLSNPSTDYFSQKHFWIMFKEVRQDERVFTCKKIRFVIVFSIQTLLFVYI